MKNVVELARKDGYTQTLYGRRRYIPELTSSNFNIRQGAERIALNTPIQGTAADLIKMAMIRVHDALKKHYPQAKLILQVHDELIVECPKELAEEVAKLVSREMEQIAVLNVPLTAEAKLILQVHDELIVECPKDIADAVSNLVSEQMQQVATLHVPLLAEAKWGNSWYEAK
jgi:DNA polymerase I-like protein with 3'-5' exonuclease and polymerase domains